VVLRATAQRDAANAATEADAYKRTKIAEANKVAAVQDAEASAAAVRFAGEAERDKQVALAAGIRAEGDARASAIQAEGLASAASTDAKALALQKYGEAALAQEIISRLPDIVRAAAEPIASIDKLTVVSTDGASEMTKTVGKVLGEGTEVVKNLTGLDLNTLLQSFALKTMGTDAVAAVDGARSAATGIAKNAKDAAAV
jgi:flotillin